LGIFCGHFGVSFPVLVLYTKKNLATLILITTYVHRKKMNVPCTVGRVVTLAELQHGLRVGKALDDTVHEAGVALLQRKSIAT
jgi:hypothetical protein